MEVMGIIFFIIGMISFIYATVAIMMSDEETLREKLEGDNLFMLMLLGLIMMALNVDSLLSDPLVADWLTF